MLTAMIECPTTGKMISTGVAFGDRATFENPTNVFSKNTVQCRECGQLHEWSREDVTLQETT